MRLASLQVLTDSIVRTYYLVIRPEKMQNFDENVYDSVEDEHGRAKKQDSS